MISDHLLIAALLFAWIPLQASGEETDVSRWITTADQWSALRGGEVILLGSDADGEDASHSATAAILVDADADDIWKVVDDGNKAAGFQDSLVSSEILERTPEFTRIAQVVKIGFHKVKYVVRQTPRPPSVIDFSLESGDLKEMDGFWRFLPIGEGDEKQTLVIYRLSIEPLIPIPGFLIRKSIAKNLPDTLRSVREETLRRASSS